MAELSPYEPTWRDRIAAALMGNDRASPERRRVVEGLLGSSGLGSTGFSLIDATPAGAPLMVDDAARAAQSGDYVGAGLNTAGAALAVAPVLGPIAKGAKSLVSAAKPAEEVASRSSFLYDPPTKAPRPFEADYPNGAPVDASGRLTQDIDGRPLTARYVVGRTEDGGRDVALPGQALDAVAEARMGAPSAVAPQSALGRDVGRSVFGPDGSLKEVAISGSLKPPQSGRVLAHEIGHVIDQAAGEIPTDGLGAELRGVYNSLNNGQRNTAGTDVRANAKPFLPQHNDYKGDDIPREYIAEAIRAYATDPNYLKTVAPNTAARIRQYVNDNPKLKDVIQFNTIAAGAAAGAGAVLGPDNAEAQTMAGPWEKYAAQPAEAPAVDGPWAKYAASASAPEQPGMVTSVVRGVSQGLTLGAGDEGSAVAAASPIPGAERRARILPLPDPIDLLSGGARMVLEKVAPGTFGAGGGQAYDRGLESRRADDNQAKAANPISYGAGEIAGGVVPVVAAAGAAPAAFGLRGGLAARSAMSAGSGFGVGAVQGFNSGEGGFLSRAEEASKGALGGAVIGAVAPGLGQVAGNVYRRIGDALVNRTATMPGYNSRAVQVVADALEAQRAINPSLEADIARLGPDAMLVDAGDALKGLAQGVSVRPGEARSRIVQALTDRKTGTNARVGADLDSALGPAVVPSQVEAGLAQGRQAVGDAYGEVFRNARAVDTTTLANQLDTMAVDLRGDPRRAVMQARDMLNIPGQRVLDPSPRALFNTRQALDGLMESEKDSKVLSQLGFVRQAVDDYLGQAVPGLKQVDARFQELARQSEGLKAGSSVLDSGKTAMRPAEMADAVTAGARPDGTMVGPSAETFRMRQGVRGEIDRLVGTKSNDYLAVRDAVKGEGDWNRAKLVQLFGEDRANQVVNAVDREAAFEKVYRDVVENSQTKMRDAAEKLVAIRDGKAGEGAGVTAIVGSVGGPAAVAGQAALKGGKAVKSVMDVAADQARNNDVARMLLMPSNEIAPVLDVLARNSRGRAAAETGSRTTERIVQALLQSRGYDTGRLGAPHAQRFARSAF